MTQNFCCNSFPLIIIIIVTGIIGGFINFLSIEPHSKDKDNSQVQQKKIYFYLDKVFYLQILLGICGAGLIPLFLYLTSSKLFEKCDDCFFVYFIFSGYCLIGAVFSRAILNSLSNKIFNLEKDLNKQRQDLKNVKKEIQEQQVEPENIIETNPDTIKEEFDKSSSMLDTDINTYMKGSADKEIENILSDLQNSKYRDRSINGISKTTKIHINNVSIIINAFVKVGLVIPVSWYGRTFYRLTLKGKQAKFTKQE